MQPKFSIDLHFDAEIKIQSMDPEKTIDITAEDNHMFGTSMANGSNWTKLVNEGVNDLQCDLIIKLKASNGPSN